MDLKMNFLYVKGQNIDRFVVKTFAKTSTNTAEGMLMSANYKGALRCALDSDIILHYGIQSSTSFIGAIVGFILRKRQVAISQTLSIDLELRRKWWIKYTKKVIFHFCQKHVAQTEISIKTLVKVYNISDKNIRYIPFESGLLKLSEKIRHFDFRDINRFGEPIKFLFAGNLIKLKGIFLLIDAISILKRKGYRAQVVFAGPESVVDHEPRISELEEYARLKCSEDVVQFTGDLLADDLLVLYHECDVFILPTFKDTFGKVIVEAALIGRPIITSDACGGVDTIVFNNVNGLVFESGSLESLVECMISLTNRDLIARMGIASKKIIENYTEKVSNESDMYKELILSFN